MNLDKTYFGLKFLATSVQTNGAFFMCETSIPAGDLGPPMHIHTHESEGFYLRKGQLTFEIDGRVLRLRGGEYLHVNPGEFHTWRNECDEPADLLIIFTPGGIEQMFLELEKDALSFREIGQKYGTVFQ